MINSQPTTVCKVYNIKTCSSACIIQIRGQRATVPTVLVTMNSLHTVKEGYNETKCFSNVDNIEYVHLFPRLHHSEQLEAPCSRVIRKTSLMRCHVLRLTFLS